MVFTVRVETGASLSTSCTQDQKPRGEDPTACFLLLEQRIFLKASSTDSSGGSRFKPCNGRSISYSARAAETWGLWISTVGLKALSLVHTGLVPIPKLPKVPPQAPTLRAGLVSHILLMYPRTLTLNRMAPSSILGTVGLAL